MFTLISAASAFQAKDLLGFDPFNLPVSFGKCPTFQDKQEFNTTKYLGGWYELYRFANCPYESGECATTNYTLRANGDINVDNTMQKINSDGSLAPRSGLNITARFQDPSKHEGHLHVYFDPLPFYGQYNVIDTDYDSYTFVYECDQFGPVKFESGWILSRKNLDHKNPADKADIDRIQQLAEKTFKDKTGTDFSVFRPTLQNSQNKAEGCKYMFE